MRQSRYEITIQVNTFVQDEKNRVVGQHETTSVFVADEHVADESAYVVPPGGLAFLIATTVAVDSIVFG